MNPRDVSELANDNDPSTPSHFLKMRKELDRRTARYPAITRSAIIKTIVADMIDWMDVPVDSKGLFEAISGEISEIVSEKLAGRGRGVIEDMRDIEMRLSRIDELVKDAVKCGVVLPRIDRIKASGIFEASWNQVALISLRDSLELSR